MGHYTKPVWTVLHMWTRCGLFFIAGLDEAVDSLFIPIVYIKFSKFGGGGGGMEQ